MWPSGHRVPSVAGRVWPCYYSARCGQAGVVCPVFWPGVAMLIIGQGWLSGRGVPMQCLLAWCGRVNNWPGVARVGSGVPSG